MALFLQNKRAKNKIAQGRKWEGFSMQAKTETQKGIRWDVFIPCFLVIGGAAILGVVNNAWLTKVT